MGVKKSTVLLGGVLLVGLGVGASLLIPGTENPEPAQKVAELPQEVAVQVMAIEPQNFTAYGHFIGQVDGIQQARLLAYAGGRVQKVLAKEGDEVKKGQKLCSIEGEQMETAFESAQLAEKITSRTLERRRKAAKNGSVSQLQVDAALSENLQARAALITARRNHQGGFCEAPFAGTVVERFIQPWQDLRPGDPTFVIADLSVVKVRFGVPENEISGYTEGAPVRLGFSGLPEQTWVGEVFSISRKVADADRTFQLEAHVPNDQGLMRPGYTTDVTVERYRLHEQVVIPTSAILTAGKEQYVYIHEDHHARRRQITVLAGDKSQSVVKSGLEFGQQLIVSGILSLGDGALVKVVPGNGVDAAVGVH